MKRDRIILSFLIVVGIVLCYILLRTICNVKIEELVEQVLSATLTGCVFAVPSGIAVLCIEFRKFKLQQGKLLAELYSAFDNFNIGEFLSYTSSHTERQRYLIFHLYESLFKNNLEYFGNNTNKVSELLKNIFDFCLSVSILNTDYSENKITTQSEFDSYVAQINSVKSSCIELIKSLQGFG